MRETFDLSGILLALGVIALFGVFFWYVAYRFWSAGKLIAGLIDSRAARDRERPAFEAGNRGVPAWKRAAQILLIGALIALLWFRFRGV
jgi:membrane glycosyltransferase